ncbi:MAG TPA: hypothetical protein VK034_22225, partial [Enhygromyxa sp.]|nr:hypothetical protein [Enhygromyxa sp.]
GKFMFAYVKVGTKRFLIEPQATIQLIPGSHKVQVRLSDDTQWVTFGKIEVKPKQALTVELIKPNGLKLSP